MTWFMMLKIWSNILYLCDDVNKLLCGRIWSIIQFKIRETDYFIHKKIETRHLHFYSNNISTYMAYILCQNHKHMYNIYSCENVHWIIYYQNRFLTSLVHCTTVQYSTKSKSFKFWWHITILKSLLYTTKCIYLLNCIDCWFLVNSRIIFCLNYINNIFYCSKISFVPNIFVYLFLDVAIP